jgi:hypothetical protein
VNTIKQRLAMGLMVIGTLTALGGTSAVADERSYRDDGRRYEGRQNWWQDERRHRGRHDDWNRRHRGVYVPPGHVYYPPPVVYSRPPVHPGFGFYFGIPTH